MELKERFLKYVALDTQSCEESESYPSTDKQRVLLDLLADGLTNRQIAERMFLAEKTVRNHVTGILAKLGVVPLQIAGSDIYPALEKGTIDAAEWVGPYDDEKLGFYKIAKYYYYPGFWEPGPQVSFYIGKEAWARLPKAYQAALRCAAAETNVKMLADYDAKNPAALARLLKQGVKLQKYPDDVLKGAFKASEELYAEESAKNPLFKKIYASWAPFRNNEARWMSIAEAPLERFMQANPLKVK